MISITMAVCGAVPAGRGKTGKNIRLGLGKKDAIMAAAFEMRPKIPWLPASHFGDKNENEFL